MTMRRGGLTRIAGVALALLGVARAEGQATWPTAAAGVRAGGSVQLQCDATGANCRPVTDANPMPTIPASGTVTQVTGNVAAGSADSGNPVKVGGRVSTSAPAATAAGQRVDAWFTPYGQTAVMLTDNGGANITTTTLNVDQYGPTPYPAINTRSIVSVYDGSAYRNLRGDALGAWTVSRGGATIATAQIAVGTSATLLAAARAGRQKIGVSVTSAVQCAFGPAGVTLATGWPLAAVAYAADSWETTAALYAVCASAATVAVREQY